MSLKIEVKGTKEEFVKVFYAVYDFMNEEKDFYFENVEVKCGKKILESYKYRSVDDVEFKDALEELLKKAQKSIKIEAFGPVGRYDFKKLGVFEHIANSAPKTCFQGSISDDFLDYGETCLKAEAKDTQVHLSLEAEDDYCIEKYSAIYDVVEKAYKNIEEDFIEKDEEYYEDEE